MVSVDMYSEWWMMKREDGVKEKKSKRQEETGGVSRLCIRDREKSWRGAVEFAVVLVLVVYGSRTRGTLYTANGLAERSVAVIWPLR